MRVTLTRDGFPDPLGWGVFQSLEQLLEHSDQILPHALEMAGEHLPMVLSSVVRALRADRWQLSSAERGRRVASRVPSSGTNSVSTKRLEKAG